MNDFLVHLYRRLDAYIPDQVWSETLLGVALLVAGALFAQWGVARVVLYLAHRLLVLTGREDWDQALRRRRAYQNLFYAVPFAVVSANVDLVPHGQTVAEAVGRLAHAAAWIFLFSAL